MLDSVLLRTPTLRPAARDDLPRLVEVARRSWLSAFAQTAPFALVRAWAAADREPGWYETYWPAMTVAEVEGEVVGLVQPLEDEVNGLWVHPSAQGTGVGSLLLRAAEEQLRGAGHARAWLTCSGFNPRAAGFYRARGYALARRCTEHLECGVDEEVWIFEKELRG